ncbi:hypothetical protein TYRP_017613 [Tyrophagus putrescentiae]|nr:hypothetical protein TYRP_017613 [Tyrophagus putrescentiae]
MSNQLIISALVLPTKKCGNDDEEKLSLQLFGDRIELHYKASTRNTFQQLAPKQLALTFCWYTNKKKKKKKKLVPRQVSRISK